MNNSVINFQTIAVDFDGTLCYSKWPELGQPNQALIAYLQEWKRNGNKLILWTCRAGDALTKAVEWCREQNLEFDAVNDNLPEIIEYYVTDTTAEKYRVITILMIVCCSQTQLRHSIKHMICLFGVFILLCLRNSCINFCKYICSCITHSTCL